MDEKPDGITGSEESHTKQVQYRRSRQCLRDTIRYAGDMVKEASIEPA